MSECAGVTAGGAWGCGEEGLAWSGRCYGSQASRPEGGRVCVILWGTMGLEAVEPAAGIFGCQVLFLVVLPVVSMLITF